MTHISRVQARSVIEGFPALRDSKERLRAVACERGDARQLAAAVEADPALTLAVLRRANEAPFRGGVASVREAVEALAPECLAELADDCPTFEFFGMSAHWNGGAERFRVHALAVQRLAALVANRTQNPYTDAIVTAATLHDLGKLPLSQVSRDTDDHVEPQATPQAGVRLERRIFGVDHAQLGGALARSWNLPRLLCEAIERHHDDRPEGIAAVLAVADMLAHFAAADPIDLQRLAEIGNQTGIGRKALRAMLHELPYPISVRHRLADRCPLSERELEIVRALREGKVGKQIASARTLREHDPIAPSSDIRAPWRTALSANLT